MRWRRLTGNRLSFAALCGILVVVAAALLAPWVAPHDPDETDAEATLSSVSLRHPLGTDIYGAISSRASSTPRVSTSSWR